MGEKYEVRPEISVCSYGKKWGLLHLLPRCLVDKVFHDFGDEYCEDKNSLARDMQAMITLLDGVWPTVQRGLGVAWGQARYYIAMWKVSGLYDISEGVSRMVTATFQGLIVARDVSGGIVFKVLCLVISPRECGQPPMLLECEFPSVGDPDTWGPPTAFPSPAERRCAVTALR